MYAHIYSLRKRCSPKHYLLYINKIFYIRYYSFFTSSGCFSTDYISHHSCCLSTLVSLYEMLFFLFRFTITSKVYLTRKHILKDVKMEVVVTLIFSNKESTPLYKRRFPLGLTEGIHALRILI